MDLLERVMAHPVVVLNYDQAGKFLIEPVEIWLTWISNLLNED